MGRESGGSLELNSDDGIPDEGEKFLAAAVSDSSKFLLRIVEVAYSVRLILLVAFRPILSLALKYSTLPQMVVKLAMTLLMLIMMKHGWGSF